MYSCAVVHLLFLLQNALYAMQLDRLLINERKSKTSIYIYRHKIVSRYCSDTIKVDLYPLQMEE